MKSPNGQYEVVMHDFGELRMGSPLFGRIEIRGAPFDTGDQEFGEPMAFSPDSRFLATVLLVSTVPDPHTRAVVFDFELKRQIIVHDQNPGLLRRLTWSPDGLLTVVSWTLAVGELEHSWQAPPPQPQGFWKKIFG
ncbi:MAG TPA: hypothetical protein VNN22_12115 [Verrucomicrobiae bacterium]|nr:hypothetical protein [Verrucomicrobiae bacterium]